MKEKLESLCTVVWRGLLCILFHWDERVRALVWDPSLQAVDDFMIQERIINGGRRLHFRVVAAAAHRRGQLLRPCKSPIPACIADSLSRPPSGSGTIPRGPRREPDRLRQHDIRSSAALLLQDLDRNYLEMDHPEQPLRSEHTARSNGSEHRSEPDVPLEEDQVSRASSFLHNVESSYA